MPDDDPAPTASTDPSRDVSGGGRDASGGPAPGDAPDTPDSADSGPVSGVPPSPSGDSGRRATSEPGAPARFGRRLAALVVDCVISAFAAAFFTRPEPPRLWSAVVFFVAYTFFLGVFGQTPGMRLFRIACVRVDGARTVGIPRAAVRALLLQLFVPAVFLDREGRGWHDRAAGTVVINV